MADDASVANDNRMDDEDKDVIVTDDVDDEFPDVENNNNDIIKREEDLHSNSEISTNIHPVAIATSQEIKAESSSNGQTTSLHVDSDVTRESPEHKEDPVNLVKTDNEENR